MRVLPIVLLALCCGSLAAQAGGTQPQASADKESFVFQPKSLATGAKAQTLRLVCNTAGGFSSSSSKPPLLSFGAGVTVVPGSFMPLNVNEAECKVDVAADAFSAVEAKLELYSVNGTAVLQTLRSTLGILGPQPVSGSQAQVSVESVELVRVNVTTAQTAGNVVIAGPVTGSVRLTAPTGVLVSAAPVAVTSAGEINTAQLIENNTVFSFAIGNAAAENVTVRITQIKYNTALFGVSGGVSGNLACELEGAALAGKSALVINAHTALTTVQGTNDNSSAPPTTSQTSPSTDTTKTSTPSKTTVDSGNRNSRSLEDNQRQNNRNQNDPQAPARQPSGPVQQGQVNAPRSGPQPVPAPPQQADNPAPPPPPNQPQPAAEGARPVPGGSSGGSNYKAAGDSGWAAADGEKPAAEEAPKATQPEPAKLETSPGLYFCDKDFQPLGAVVLRATTGEEAAQRVWIVLKREKDKDSTRIETVTVKLTVCGVARELTLTETGRNTGEFRCGKDGVLLVANENPDSNREMNAPAEPPKPRIR
ncbi:MAG: hypothetical protein IT463_02050 [Planctomycetes bacterium]|nr:hypothetical protein [Planctomycetota bacterium]